MEIIENKALLFPAEHRNKILNVTHTAAKYRGKVLVKWDVENVQALEEIGISAPSPIEGKYQWTGIHPPFDHQKTTASFLTKHRRAFCFSQQGTGKTASAIWAADYLLKEKLIRRVLVICPISIMDAAWRNDLFTFAMHRRVDIAYGPAAKRRKIVQSDAEFVIINYDGLQVVEEEVRSGGFDLIIVDEATHYKNANTKRWKTLGRLLTPDTWLWLMTGTPAAQGPLDAYGLAKLVNPKGVPRTFSMFRDEVMHKVSQFRWEPKPEAVNIVHNALQPAIRFTKEECLDLPEMVYVKRFVEMSKQQARYYEDMRKKLLFEAAGEHVTAVNAAVKANKLLQISCGAVYTDDSDVVQFDIKSRYSVLKEVIDETENKVLVFVPFQHTIAELSERLTKDGITNEVISGSVAAGKRGQVFEDFQNKNDPRVLVIQPQAAAHGVTLTRADTIVWWSPTPSLEIYEQANARIHRSGQVNKCTVIQLQGSGAERHVYNLLDKKIDVHTKIVDLYRDILD